MTEGKGFCARRQEKQREKNLKWFIENKDKVIVVE